jgi:phosphatidylserine decarboxylase
MKLLLKWIPRKKLSQWIGRIVNFRLPWPLSYLSVYAFAKYYRIDINAAEKPLQSYKTIGALFTRKLKPGLREISSHFIVHPADSLITQAAKFSSNELIQAKGISYRLTDFLTDLPLSEKLQDGIFMTYYLCPTDYHRVHSPVSGTIKKRIHLPGDLWPVNEWSTTSIKDLFCINERVVVEIETDFGTVAVVFVGATNVGRISLSFEPDFLSNQGRDFKTTKLSQYKINKGQELGVFHMGSTVVLVCEKTLAPYLTDVEAFKGLKVQQGSWI